MRSVRTAWFQFWGKHLLHIDVLSFHDILNVQHLIEYVQLERQKKALKCNDTSHFVCQAAWRTPTIRMQRFAYGYAIWKSIGIWNFILNSTNIWKPIDISNSHYRLVGSSQSARPTSAGCVKLQHWITHFCLQNASKEEMEWDAVGEVGCVIQAGQNMRILLNLKLTFNNR